jgi:hypothetical protein
MKEKILILTPDDFYDTPYGKLPRGRSKRFYDAHLVVSVDHNGDILEVLKDREYHPIDKIEEIIGLRKDRRLLLLCQ